MTAPRIMRFTWDGEAMRPLHPGVADRQYVVGETYPLEVREERSGNSHRHYFACINAAHATLPEHLAERFPTAEHLRKWLLIRVGYRDERSIVAASKAEAQRIAAFVRPVDTFAVVVAQEATVTILTAKSQSMRAMGKREFAESKSKVLDALAELIGVERETLAANAGKAA